MAFNLPGNENFEENQSGSHPELQVVPTTGPPKLGH